MVSNLRRFGIAAAMTLLLALISPIQIAAAANIAGTKCTKVSATKTIANIKYTCIKSGKNLIWNKGINLKPTPKPIPSPTASSSKPPSPSSSSSATPSPSNSSTPIPNTTPTPLDPRASGKKFEVSGVNQFQSLESCKISSTVTNPLNAGFPRNQKLGPSKGIVKGVTIFVDYPDLVATGDELRVWKTQQVPTAQNYFRRMSYGKMDFQVDLIEKVYRVNKSVLTYNLDTAHGAPTKPNADTQGLVKDAILAADSDIDFSKYDFVNVVTPSTNLIGFEGVIGFDYVADGKQFNFATFGPIREYADDVVKYPWLVHEYGHIMGLIHPYNTSGNYYKNYGIIAWDLMGNAITFAPEYLAWNKFLLGWFDSSQVQCLNSNNKSSTISLITPISNNDDGVKTTLVRISDYEILVVENRRASELNKINRNEEGIVVYTVNTTVGSDLGAVTVLYNRETVRNGHLLGTLIPGEVVKYKNVTLEVLSSTESGDYIGIQIG